MPKKTRISILIVLTIITAFTLVHQSIGLKSEIKKIKLPTKENRLVGSMSTYKWISVKKLSRKFNISEQDIFKDLEIVSQKGDENLSITALAKKYNKTEQSIKNALRKLLKIRKPIRTKL